MRIGRIATTASGPNGQQARDTQLTSAGESRALVALMPADATHTPSESHRQAAFLAHLIATKDQLPQTRERRRAEPAEAIAAYRTAASLLGQ